VATQLSGNETTLLLPLWARARASRRGDALIVDRKAVDIIEQLSHDDAYREVFDRLDAGLPGFVLISQLVRAHCIDTEIREFLGRHPAGTVVNIGAGLDTTFERVDNGSLRWFDLDLPDVITLRRRLLPDGERSRSIAADVRDTRWFDELGDVSGGLLCVACGVLFFLEKSEACQLIEAMARRFPGSELAFDSMSRLFVAIANRRVLSEGGVGGGGRMTWPLRSARTLQKWAGGIEVLDEYPMFSRVAWDPAWGRDVRRQATWVNRLHGINVFHLRLGPSGG
jgi:O-methyltransferase involved in polyketide biosynthesis